MMVLDMNFLISVPKLIRRPSGQIILPVEQVFPSVISGKYRGGNQAFKELISKTYADFWRGRR